MFRDTSIVAEVDVDARRISTVRRATSLTLADCTSRRSRAFGVTAAVHSSEDYALTQAWAAAFARQGFDGVRYLLSHDPAQRLVGLALFGPSGSPRWARGQAATIALDLIREAERSFGIRVLPSP